ADGTQTSAQMMSQANTFAYLRVPGLQMLRMPYGKGRMSMLILLPDSTQGLSTLVPTLTAEQLQSWIGCMGDEYGNVTLPRFTAQFGNEIGPILQAQGMQIAFACPNNPSPEGVADFSALTSAPACITGVAHKAWVKVDEMGTVAAAATTVVVGITAV